MSVAAYDYWAALVADRAPNPGDVVTLSRLEREDLAKLRGTRRLPPLLFGRKVIVANEVAS